MADRKPAAALGITAAILATWIGYEGFSARPIIPTKGDVPTIGHGSTYYEGGRRVTLSDPPITRARAAQLAATHLDAVYVRCVKARLGDTPVSEVEFALAVDFAGNYGCAKYAQSSIARYTVMQQYPQACAVYLEYRFQAGRDCKLEQNWGPTGCKGVWTRSEDRYKRCMAAQ